MGESNVLIGAMVLTSVDRSTDSAVATVGALFFTALRNVHGVAGYPVAMTWAATVDCARVILGTALSPRAGDWVRSFRALNCGGASTRFFRPRSMVTGRRDALITELERARSPKGFDV